MGGFRKLANSAVYVYAAVNLLGWALRFHAEKNGDDVLRKQAALVAYQKREIAFLKCQVDMFEHPADAFNCASISVSPPPPPFPPLSPFQISFPPSPSQPALISELLQPLP